MRHVVFRVASERYALPLDAVSEVVVPQPPFARVPRAS
ncbi:MAG TPA: chemotaxis protein CheW, partial [Anaeromyxobacter sp.]